MSVCDDGIKQPGIKGVDKAVSAQTIDSLFLLMKDTLLKFIFKVPSYAANSVAKDLQFFKKKNQYVGISPFIPCPNIFRFLNGFTK